MSFPSPAAHLPRVFMPAVLLLAGCTQTMVLGTDCPELDTACLLEVDAGDEPIDAAVEVDGDVPDAAADDASAPSDASGDAIVVQRLGLQNMGFERAKGLGGDIVLSEVVSTLTLGLLDTLGIAVAELKDWYACWYGTVNSVSYAPSPDNSTPFTIGDYLDFRLNSGLPGTDLQPARQLLATPMKAGVTYALAMQVVSRPDPGGAALRIEIRGHKDHCGGTGVLLKSSPPLSSTNAWQRICLQFTPTEAYPYFLLMPAYDGNVRPSTAAHLLVDSLEHVDSCGQ